MVTPGWFVENAALLLREPSSSERTSSGTFAYPRRCRTTINHAIGNIDYAIHLSGGRYPPEMLTTTAPIRNDVLTARVIERLMVSLATRLDQPSAIDDLHALRGQLVRALDTMSA